MPFILLPVIPIPGHTSYIITNWKDGNCSKRHHSPCGTSDVATALCKSCALAPFAWISTAEIDYFRTGSNWLQKLTYTASILETVEAIV